MLGSIFFCPQHIGNLHCCCTLLGLGLTFEVEHYSFTVSCCIPLDLDPNQRLSCILLLLCIYMLCNFVWMSINLENLGYEVLISLYFFVYVIFCCLIKQTEEKNVIKLNQYVKDSYHHGSCINLIPRSYENVFSRGDILLWLNCWMMFLYADKCKAFFGFSHLSQDKSSLVMYICKKRYCRTI